MCSELTPRAHIPDTRIPQLMQPWSRSWPGWLPTPPAWSRGRQIAITIFAPLARNQQSGSQLNSHKDVENCKLERLRFVNKQLGSELSVGSKRLRDKLSLRCHSCFGKPENNGGGALNKSGHLLQMAQLMRRTRVDHHYKDQQYHQGWPARVCKPSKGIMNWWHQLSSS